WQAFQEGFRQAGSPASSSAFIPERLLATTALLRGLASVCGPFARNVGVGVVCLVTHWQCLYPGSRDRRLPDGWLGQSAASTLVRYDAVQVFPAEVLRPKSRVVVGPETVGTEQTTG